MTEQTTPRGGRKPRQCRWRDRDKEDCPKCGAPLGKKCQDYRRRGKAPCSIPVGPEQQTLTPAAPVEPTQPDWRGPDYRWNQLLLWDDMPPM